MSYLISKNQKDTIDYFKNYFDLTAINNINYFIIQNKIYLLLTLLNCTCPNYPLYFSQSFEQ